MSLQAILRGASTPLYPLIIFQSSAAQSSLPLLRSLLGQIQTRIIICNLLYPKRFIVDGLPHELIEILDCTADVPGFGNSAADSRERLLSAMNSAIGSQPLTVVIDSLDTLLSNLSSKAAVYAYLRDVLVLIRTRAGSRLIIHALAPSALPIIPLLTTPTFSPTLAYITAHPPILLTHLATFLSTSPPPLSPPEKFWNVFLPLAGRTHDIEDLVFGARGDGSAGNGDIVAEILLRGSEASEGAIGRRKKGVERMLEGWISSQGVACELKDLTSLQNLFVNKSASTEPIPAPDPTQNLSFNLTLTPEQQQSRTQVPLPYAHTGATAVPTQQASAILYDPDSADDIDDDDPDEDLDI